MDCAVRVRCAIAWMRSTCLCAIAWMRSTCLCAIAWMRSTCQVCNCMDAQYVSGVHLHGCAVRVRCAFAWMRSTCLCAFAWMCSTCLCASVRSIHASAIPTAAAAAAAAAALSCVVQCKISICVDVRYMRVCLGSSARSTHAFCHFGCCCCCSQECGSVLDVRLCVWMGIFCLHVPNYYYAVIINYAVNNNLPLLSATAAAAAAAALWNRFHV